MNQQAIMAMNLADRFKMRAEELLIPSLRPMKTTEVKGSHKCAIMRRQRIKRELVCRYG